MDGFRKVLMCLGGEEITGAEPRGEMPGEPVRIPGGAALSQVLAAGPYRADLSPKERYIYVSSRPKHIPKWEDWVRGGVLSVRWVSAPRDSSDTPSPASREAVMRGAMAVLLYEEAGDQNPAMYFDYGLAMGLEIPVVYVGPNASNGSLFASESVTAFPSLMGALEYLAAVLA